MGEGSTLSEEDVDALFQDLDKDNNDKLDLDGKNVLQISFDVFSKIYCQSS